MADVVFKVTVDSQGAVKNVEQVSTALGGMAKASGGAQQSVGAFGTVMSGVGSVVGAGVAVVGAFAAATVGATSVVAGWVIQLGAASEAMLNLSAMTGETYDELQGLSLAGDLVGVPLDQITASVGKMQKSIAEGSDKTIMALRGIGLSAEQLKGMGAAESLDLILTRIQQIPVPADRTAAAMSLLGKSGAALLPLAGQLAGMADKAKELGGVSEETARRAAALDDEIGTLQKAWANLFAQMAGGVASSKVLEALINETTAAVAKLAVYVRDNQGAIRDFVSQGLIYLADGLILVVSGVNLLGDSFIGLQMLFNVITAGAGAAAIVLGRMAQVAALRTGDLAGYRMFGALIEEIKGGIETQGKALDANMAKLNSWDKTAGAAVKGAEALRDRLQDVKSGADVSGTAATGAAKNYKYLGDAAVKAAQDAEKAADKAVASAIKLAQTRNLMSGMTQFGGILGDKLPTINPGGAMGDTILNGVPMAGLEAGRGLDVLIDGTERATKSAEDLRAENERLVSGLLNLASAVAGLGQAFGGFNTVLGSVLTLGAGALNVFANLSDKALQAKSNTEKAAMAVAALTSIVSNKDANVGNRMMSGAMSGAAAGAAFGPMGALIGGGAGALLGGLFGGPSAAEKAAAEQGRRIGQIVGRTVSEEAQKAIDADMKRLHIDLQSATLLNLPQIMSESGNAGAMGPQVQQLFSAVLSGAVPAREGVAALSDSFQQLADAAEETGGYATASMQAIIKQSEEAHLQIASVVKYVTDQAQQQNDSLVTLFDGVQKGAAGGTAELSMFSSLASDTFTKLRAQGLSFTQIFKVLGPSIDAGIEAFERLGETVPQSLKELADLRNLVKENGPLLAGIDAFGSMLKSSLNLGLINASNGAERLGQAGKFVSDKMTELSTAGFSAEQSLAIMGPTLGQLHDASVRLGIPLDENTEKLYQQALAAGAIPTDAMSQLVAASERLVGVLSLIAEKLGVAREELERFNGTPQPNPASYPGAPGTTPAGPPKAQPLAMGVNNLLVTKPSLFLVGEAGPERMTVTPLGQQHRPGFAPETVTSGGWSSGASSSWGDGRVGGGMSREDRRELAEIMADRLTEKLGDRFDRSLRQNRGNVAVSVGGQQVVRRTLESSSRARAAAAPRGRRG